MSPSLVEVLATPLERVGTSMLLCTGAFAVLQMLFAYVIVPRFAPKGLKAAQYGDLVRKFLIYF